MNEDNLNQQQLPTQEKIQTTPRLTEPTNKMDTNRSGQESARLPLNEVNKSSNQSPKPKLSAEKVESAKQSPIQKQQTPSNNAQAYQSKPEVKEEIAEQRITYLEKQRNQVQQQNARYQQVPPGTLQQQQQIPMRQYNPSAEYQQNAQNFQSQKPQSKLQQKYQFREVPLHRAPWNGRFCVQSVLNNALPHKFFREFFDKPTRQKQEDLLKPEKPDIPIEAFYRSSSLSQLLFDNKSKKKRRIFREVVDQQRQSTAGSLQGTGKFSQGSLKTRSSMQGGELGSSQSFKTLLTKEFAWDDKFQVMFSKNNDQVHISQKELLDKPIHYDVKGYVYSEKPDPMTVYDRSTPILQTMRWTSPTKSPDQRREHFRCEKQQFNQHVFTASLRNPSYEPLLAQTATSIEPNLTRNASTAVPTMRKSSSQKSIGAARRSIQTAQSFRPKTRNVKYKVAYWSDRVGLPVSTYNEGVFKKYRIMFENL